MIEVQMGSLRASAIVEYTRCHYNFDNSVNVCDTPKELRY